jgi:glycogen synthase
MRVLHLTPEFPPVIWGGLGTAVGGLVTASARAEMSVGVLLVGGVLVGERNYGAWQPVSVEQLEQISSEQPFVNSDGVIFFHVSPADAEEAGIRLVHKWKPDVIHLHTAWLWPVARAIQEQTGTPLVFTVHSLDRAEYEIGAFVTQWDIQDSVIAAADRVIAISQSERELLAYYCPEALGRVRICGNGIDDCVRARNAAREKIWDRTSPLVLYTGRFVERKGIRELLEAIPRVMEKAPTTHFVLVGGYGGGAEIERSWMAEALLPYRSQVHFTGWLPPNEVAKWYCAADILVVPSWYEPFGMVVLEGMLYGLPIAATSVGGPAEILHHERTGLLFPPKDAGALAETLLELITNPGLRKQIGTEAAKEVRQSWLWPHLVKKMRGVYQEAALTRSEVTILQIRDGSKELPAVNLY